MRFGSCDGGEMAKHNGTGFMEISSIIWTHGDVCLDTISFNGVSHSVLSLGIFPSGLPKVQSPRQIQIIDYCGYKPHP